MLSHLLEPTHRNVISRFCDNKNLENYFRDIYVHKHVKTSVQREFPLMLSNAWKRMQKYLINIEFICPQISFVALYERANTFPFPVRDILLSTYFRIDGRITKPCDVHIHFAGKIFRTIFPYPTWNIADNLYGLVVAWKVFNWYIQFQIIIIKPDYSLI